MASIDRIPIITKEQPVSDAYSLVSKHLDSSIAEARENNVDLNAYGQALIWMLIERYKQNGGTHEDIVSEIQYTLDNIEDDGTFHVSRN
ncbi:MAG: hypothetical protein ABGY43_19640 [bacterium]|jgi:hypothetical protein|nr:hypothetical protein [Gammaproteobacteria bacterium]HIL85110.1 hypothetical protein [Pseudomonadales bacterium]